MCGPRSSWIVVTRGARLPCLDGASAQRAVAAPLRAAGFTAVAEAAAPTEDGLMNLLPLGGLQGDASAG